jgi:hypothetical protein
MPTSSHKPSQYLLGPLGRAAAGTELQGCRPGLAPSRRQPARQRGTCKGGGATELELSSPTVSSSTTTRKPCREIHANSFSGGPQVVQPIGH